MFADTNPKGVAQLPDAALVGSILSYLPIHLLLTGTRQGPSARCHGNRFLLTIWIVPCAMVVLMICLE